VERLPVSSPTQGAWTCPHGVDGRDWCPECFGGPDDPEHSWIVRSLRAIHDEPGYDITAAIERYHEAVKRMETDPEYAEHIRQIVEEVDAQLAAGKHEATQEGFDAHGVSGYEL
jgi:hypothetical protein